MTQQDRLHRVVIVGARGAMGKLFATRIKGTGRHVHGLGRPLKGKAFKDSLEQADLVILSVPATALEQTVKLVAPHLNGAILADVTSVKIVPMSTMQRLYSGPVVGTHPLFGPVIPQGFTPRVAVTPGQGIDPGPVSNLLTQMGFTPFLATPHEHDRAMAFVQGLNYTTTVAHLAAMRQVQEIENYVTPSFLRRLESARKMLTQDQELFETISEENPLLQETVRQFSSFLNIAAGGDLELLADRARWWWQDKD